MIGGSFEGLAEIVCIAFGLPLVLPFLAWLYMLVASRGSRRRYLLYTIPVLALCIAGYACFFAGWLHEMHIIGKSWAQDRLDPALWYPLALLGFGGGLVIESLFVYWHGRKIDTRNHVLYTTPLKKRLLILIPFLTILYVVLFFFLQYSPARFVIVDLLGLLRLIPLSATGGHGFWKDFCLILLKGVIWSGFCIGVTFVIRRSVRRRTRPVVSPQRQNSMNILKLAVLIGIPVVLSTMILMTWYSHAKRQERIMYVLAHLSSGV